MITKVDFHKLFVGSYWSKLNESRIPILSSSKPIKKDFLDGLYDDVVDKRYFPQLPRGYLVYDKHNRVSRIVPVFHHRESCVYFFCIKQLEHAIAVNRVAGTFGGWTLANPIKIKEDKEVQNLPFSSVPPNSYDPVRWSENWRDFQKRAFQYCHTGDFKFFLKFDIANFYDTINLHVLEQKIRYAITKDEGFVVELLFHFLRHWNRRLEKYAVKTVGIPQDEIGDCSRILANFYLQDYDAFMKQQCDKRSAQYLRYSDDQIIFANDEESARDILFEASKELFKINLNINASKVREFDSSREFFLYWAFDIFALLEDPKDRLNVNRAVEVYFERLKSNEDFREESVLKRLLSAVGADFSVIEPRLRYKLLSKFCEPQFLVSSDYWALDKLATLLKDKDELFEILDAQVSKVRFNSFHYTLLKFYQKWRPGFANNDILKRIDELALRMD